MESRDMFPNKHKQQKNIKSYLQDEHPENENTCILKFSKTNNQMLKITIKKRELIN